MSCLFCLGMRRSTLVALVLVVLAALAAATLHRPYALRPGDLLFQVSEGGMSEAIETATSGDYSHVGFLDGSWTGHVWEAVPDQGVVRTPLRKFLREAVKDPDGRPMVTVFRVRSGLDARDAVQRARALSGRPYDFAFMPGDSTLYCSELVYECFRDPAGGPLFSSIPMTFKGPDGEILPYWVRHYETMGLPVPEGAPGTNPNDLSRDSLLDRVPVRW